MERLAAHRISIRPRDNDDPDRVFMVPVLKIKGGCRGWGLGRGRRAERHSPITFDCAKRIAAVPTTRHASAFSEPFSTITIIYSATIIRRNL